MGKCDKNNVTGKELAQDTDHFITCGTGCCHIINNDKCLIGRRLFQERRFWNNRTFHTFQSLSSVFSRRVANGVFFGQEARYVTEGIPSQVRNKCLRQQKSMIKITFFIPVMFCFRHRYDKKIAMVWAKDIFQIFFYHRADSFKEPGA